jgi:hypothetical protein
MDLDGFRTSLLSNSSLLRRVTASLSASGLRRGDAAHVQRLHEALTALQDGTPGTEVRKLRALRAVVTSDAGPREDASLGILFP